METDEYLVEHKDDLGTPDSYNHYAIGWAHAMDTPYQWTKQVASHWGGTRNGTIVSWPNGIKARGEVRNQFAHCIDVAPTVLQAAGIPEPSTVHGVTRTPLRGGADELQLRRRRRRGAAHDAVLRAARQPRHLPPGLDGRRQAQGPVGGLDARPRRRRLGAVRRRARLDPVARPRGAGTRAAGPPAATVLDPGGPVQRAADGRPLGSAVRTPTWSAVLGSCRAAASCCSRA
ncbi:sulfatase/phosphatase domain-containing protein [Aeromicrobium sp. UC242_57]|uniref:sulfatase/phosphatase domain-containing protein n=1 Tax=Aeromicrobium sp. UC242_57 TaxID=3374624 RepID=UPI0037BE67E5